MRGIFKERTGERIGRVLVIGRVENAPEDGCVQWECFCSICNKRSIIKSRDIDRYRSRFMSGCRECTEDRRGPNKKNFKYGRNANGFIDKSIMIPN
jgi:hypothetical protein